MAESGSSEGRKVELRLHLQASDDLRDLVGENLIAPDLRREFARRIFYLQMAPPEPIEVAQGDVDMATRDYLRNIEDVDSKVHMYVRPLRLVPEVGYADKEEKALVSLRFRLALTALEAEYLLATPFNGVDRHHAYALANLREEVIIPREGRSAAVEKIRRELGVYNPRARQRGVALDHKHYYYVSRPALRQYAVPSQQSQ